jgi:hypothetical protein
MMTRCYGNPFMQSQSRRQPNNRENQGSSFGRIGSEELELDALLLKWKAHPGAYRKICVHNLIQTITVL